MLATAHVHPSKHASGSWVAGVRHAQCSPCHEHSIVSFSGVIKSAASPPWCPAPAQCPGQGPSCRCQERQSAAARGPQTSSACRGCGRQSKQRGLVEQGRGLQSRRGRLRVPISLQGRQQQCRVGGSACICACMHARGPQLRQQQLLQPPSHGDKQGATPAAADEAPPDVGRESRCTGSSARLVPAACCLSIVLLPTQHPTRAVLRQSNKQAPRQPARAPNHLHHYASRLSCILLPHKPSRHGHRAAIILHGSGTQSGTAKGQSTQEEQQARSQHTLACHLTGPPLYHSRPPRPSPLTRNCMRRTASRPHTTAAM